MLEPRARVDDLDHLGTRIEQMELAAVDTTDRARFAERRKHSLQSIELEPQRVDGSIDHRRFGVVVHVHAGHRPHHGVRTNERRGERARSSPTHTVEDRLQ